MSEQEERDWQLFPPLPGERGLVGVETEDGDGDRYRAFVETICGATDDSQAVEQYNGALGVSRGFVAVHQAPVGQFQWNSDLPAKYTNPGNVNGARWGTGTLISDNLMLTAGHLFDQSANGWQLPRVNGTANIISPQEIARNQHVNFNYQADAAGNLRTAEAVAIVDLVEYRLGGVDFAIVRLAGNPGQRYGIGTLARSDARTGNMLAIIGHPAGVPKRIEAGPCSAISGDQIQYSDIDTLGGNSGSGIWLWPTGTLVGVHTNGGCTSTGGFNYGQRIGRLLEVSPTLRNLPSSNKIAVAAWGPNRLDIFGLGTDKAMYHKAWNPSGYWPAGQGWEGMGGVFTSPPAVASWSSDRLDIFGLGTDKAAYHRAWTGSAWWPSPTGWERLGGIFITPLSAVSWGPSRLDIFGIGTDGAMYHKAWSPSGYWPAGDGWESLGGVFTSPPAAVAWGPNRLDIFGLGRDSAMYHKAWDGSQWWPSQAGWHALGGVFTSPPVVESWGANRLDIFGLGRDSAMYHKAWDGSRWWPSEAGWEGLGGVFTSTPSVVSWGANRLDIFGLGRDSAMYHKAWNPNGWYPSQAGWENLGGIFTSAPASVAWGANRLDIFGLGLDSGMYHKAWTGTAWFPSPAGWEGLGGIFQAPG